MDIKELYLKFKASKGVVTDSRKELTGKIFFALRGPSFDGNAYASAAISSGALYAIVDNPAYALGENVILVDDALATLQMLATFHRNLLGVRVIGITGTNGKTTNKELLSCILSTKYKCYATKGNLNNHIGVPLSLLEIDDDHEIAVIEMGANKMGDIKELVAIVNPDFGYITNIGNAHLEGFGSKENIAIEKGELFRFIMRKNDVFFLNSSEPEVVTITKNYGRLVTIGEAKGDDMRFSLLESASRLRIIYKETELESNLYGKHNYENVKMAAGISFYFKVEVEKVQEALLSYWPENNRSQQVVKAGLHIFMDAYNANPSSMESSILSFASFYEQEKMLILGDMLELGEHELVLHRALLEYVSKYTWKDVVLVGEVFASFKDQYPTFHFFSTLLGADLYIGTEIPQGTYILVKGSRGIALEKLSFLQKLI